MKEKLDRLGAFLGSPAGSWVALSLIVLFSLPLTIPTFQSYFTFDDLQNLSYYLRKPVQSLLGNLIVFTSSRRPAGAIFYLTFYQLFGMNPLPLYVTTFLLFNLNLGLVFFLGLRLTERRLVGVAGAAAVAFHPHVHNVIFNFGAIYELLALASLMGSLHCYLSLRQSGSWNRWYFATFLFFLLGLNAKETVVVLPAILLAYEILYGPDRRDRGEMKRVAVRLTPFWLVAMAYTLVKSLGEEAFWRHNPAYQFQFDWTFYRNITAYLRELSYGAHAFTGFSTALLLAVVFAVCLLLRRRDSLFGLAFAFLTLLPVLLLPRVWGLFLYIPLAGIGICAGSVAAGILDWVRNRAGDRLPVQAQHWTLLGFLALLVFLRGALVYSAPRVRYAREVHYHALGGQWRSFAAQLYALYPNLDSPCLLAFRNPPFDPETENKWCLHFLVWLKYEDQIRVYRLPEQLEEFRNVHKRFQQVHIFDWVDGRLLERDLEELHLE